MSVVIINFPPTKEGQDAAFREWFAETSKTFASHQGFIGRRLLKPRKGGNYVAIVEHETYETFMAMHDSPAHAEAGKHVFPLFDGVPTPIFCDVIVE
ncbi:MAG: antibiotic biosynthesis monooxygenase [Desulfobulbaceae bacterium]|nr:antibiotic biosynthesis monooxygenase [Desulfobulbaceae bacterium]